MNMYTNVYLCTCLLIHTFISYLYVGHMEFKCVTKQQFGSYGYWLLGDTIKRCIMSSDRLSLLPAQNQPFFHFHYEIGVCHIVQCIILCL